MNDVINNKHQQGLWDIECPSYLKLYYCAGLQCIGFFYFDFSISLREEFRVLPHRYFSVLAKSINNNSGLNIYIGYSLSILGPNPKKCHTIRTVRLTRLYKYISSGLYTVYMHRLKIENSGMPT